MFSGVPEPAAHMFLFYYAVLADVSPPTALAPFAAAAVTRGDAFCDDAPGVEVPPAGVPRAVSSSARRRSGMALPDVR
jgi:hypothetical protein